MNIESHNTKESEVLKEKRSSMSNQAKVFRITLVLVGLLFLVLFYQGIGKLQKTQAKLQDLQSELQNQHETLIKSKSFCKEHKLINLNEIPEMIALLTGQGRNLGIKFRSISPGDLQKTKQDGIQTVSIRFDMESQYQNLGQYLEYLESFSNSILKVTKITIQRGKEKSSTLNMNLLIDLYVEAEYEKE